MEGGSRMTNAVTPSYLLQLFRQGKDTFDLARDFKVHESLIVRLLADARNDERTRAGKEPETWTFQKGASA
jgi:hypothetical protein